MKCLSTRRIQRLSIGVGIMVLALFPVFLYGTSQPTAAQCGSSASSCKNCHEVQGNDPVGNKGEWHVTHAFGDFCEFCHAGNVEAKTKEEAHVGLVHPMLDIKASCQSCHPQDYVDKAKVYATALGIQLNVGGAAASASGAAASKPASSTANISTTAKAAGNVSAQTATTATVNAASGPNLPSGGEIINYPDLYTASKLTKALFTANDKVLLGLIGLLILGFLYAIWKLEHFGERLLQWWQQNLLLSAQAPAMQGALSSAVVPLPSLSALATPAAQPERALAPTPEIVSTELDELFRRRPELRQVWPYLVRADARTLQALAMLLPQAEASEIIQRLGRLNLSLVTAMQQLSPADQALLLALAQKR